MWNQTYKKLSVIKLSTDFAEATKIFKVPLIAPNDNQVLVKNLYAGVNASDVNISAGRYFTDGKIPFDIGFEALGVIDSVGKNVTKLKAGQPALVFAGEPKAYAEYLYLKPEEIIPLPELKPEYIALLVSGLTAAIGLDQCGRIKNGDKVLITAAAGGTGHICVQWAKQRGCYVIGTTSSKEKAKLLKDLGCDRVINYNEESIDEVLTKEFPEGIDVIWETIGGSVFETLFKHLATKGRIVIVGSISSYKSQTKSLVSIADLSTKLLLHSKSLNGFFLLNFKDFYSEYLPKLIELLAKKELKIVLDFGQNTIEGQFEGIDSIARGVEYLHSGRSTGKVVIKIQDK